MQQPSKPKVTDLNPHLLCVLCKGYFIDATTVIECLHSFCRSCIVTYLERNKYCPICDVLVHKCRPLANIRPDYTLQTMVYKLVPQLFKKEMILRKDFYKDKTLHIPQNPLDRGIIPENYHIYIASELISVCFDYEYLNKHDKEPEIYNRYLKCPAGTTIFALKKFLNQKYNLKPIDSINVCYKNNLLDDHLTVMDIIYMFDWKRKEPLTMSYRIFITEILSLPSSESIEVNILKSSNSNAIPKKEQNVLHHKTKVNSMINVEEAPKKIEEKSMATDKVPDSKEVQLEISENGIMKVINISRDSIQANVTIEPNDEIKDGNPSKHKDIMKDDNNGTKIGVKVYPGSKVRKRKPKSDTVVEKIKKQVTIKYKTLTKPARHWNPSISKTAVLAKKKETNGIERKRQKFFKSRDNEMEEDKAEGTLKLLAEVPLMKINPQTLCPIISSPTTKKPTPNKNTLAHSLAVLPVRPSNHNPFTNPLNPFMYGKFPGNSNGDPGKTNDFLKAMSELCPPSSAYHNSLPPSVSVLFNPLYSNHRQSQAKKVSTTIASSPDVQQLPANKLETNNELIGNKKNGESKDSDECTNNNKGEEKMEVEKERKQSVQ